MVAGNLGSGFLGGMSWARCRALHAALRLAAGPARRGLSARPVPQEPGMEYQDAVRTLNTLQTNASFLEQIKQERGNPQVQLEAMKDYLVRSGLQIEDLDRLKIIHVTGTKGKGSTCAFTERILRGYGLKTGFYSSPHLVQVRERIRINGEPISPELFTKYFWRLYHQLEETKDDTCVSMPPYFRFLTIMAFHVFLQEKVDLAVVEVGIGGAYDCTNIVRKPVVCGISSLGIDHTSILGDTIEKIAWQKAGIFKPGVPAFTVSQPDSPLEVLKDQARQLQCPLYLCPSLEAFEEEAELLQLGLAGDHQRSNAALALQLARCWLQRQGHKGIGELRATRLTSRRSLPLAPVFHPTLPMKQGLRHTEWLGRTQVLRRGALTWYLDGAHTTSSIQAGIKWFRRAVLNQEKPVNGPEVRVLLFNATGERDTAALLKLLQPCQFDYAVFCPNLTEMSPVGNADQQNFTVTLDHMLTRCLENQKQWNQLAEEKAGQDPWLAQAPEPSTGPLHGPLLLVPPAPRPLNTNSLVFSCISHALQWISQGRDPHFRPSSPPRGLHSHPVASSGAVLLKEASSIQVLVTGSLHLVGGVLKLLDPTLSQ
ncbi:folylpolyglutamate synthase, mitochondrial isoform X2 [Antechinus flavipes]|uniref:folylpolyglutamate synthase, mitochondrial isoform X2 n=1 Tax=Antechinus flavipes TaxID=38775 RepID=UPI0022359515|nr:folylpolyglutamate synthase, mitochondrial isoform X2 [Antechinus flavipes]